MMDNTRRLYRALLCSCCLHLLLYWPLQAPQGPRQRAGPGLQLELGRRAHPTPALAQASRSSAKPAINTSKRAIRRSPPSAAQLNLPAPATHPRPTQAANAQPVITSPAIAETDAIPRAIDPLALDEYRLQLALAARQSRGRPGQLAISGPATMTLRLTLAADGSYTLQNTEANGDPNLNQQLMVLTRLAVAATPRPPALNGKHFVLTLELFSAP